MALLKALFITFALLMSSVDSNEQQIGRCQGANDGQYYLDDDPLHPAPRCCKCSMCEHYYHRIVLSCGDPNNCVGKSAECWYESDFNDHFTTITTTTATQPPPNTTVSDVLQMPATTRPLLESSAVQPARENVTPLLIVLIILCMIIALLLIFICKWCRESKIPCLRSTFLKLKTCIGVDTEKGSIELETKEISESLIQEEKIVLSEGNTPSNQCPASDSSLYHPSLSGPQGIRAENDLLHCHESDSSCYRSDFVDPSFVSNSPNVARRPDQVGSIDTRGNGNLVIAGGGNIKIGNVYVIPSKDAEGLCNITPQLPQEITNGIVREATRPNNPDVRQEPTGEDAWATQTTSRQTFPTPVSGIKYVTSMSPPLTSQVSDPRIPSSAAHPQVRRQSSEISSTSAGPVENQFDDGLTSSCQESITEVYVPQPQQYNSRQLDKSWSHRNGPVQHLDRCNQFAPFRGPVRQFSDEDSSISFAVPSESDCKGP